MFDHKNWSCAMDGVCVCRTGVYELNGTECCSVSVITDNYQFFKG